MSRFNVILATSKNNVLGKNNNIPWIGKYKDDMRFFKNMTSFNPLPRYKNIVIMGRNTWESLPKNKLPDRIPIIVSSTMNKCTNQNYFVVKNFNQAINISKNMPHYKVWVIGGKQLYSEAFNHYLCGNIYHSIIPEEIEVDDDTLELKVPEHNKIESNIINNIKFNTCELTGEVQYLRLLSKILNKGELRQTRNSKTWSLFNETLTFDLQKGFPLLTTKKMFWKGIVEELLFFIRGDTNTKHLEEKGVNIWKGNTSQEFIDKLGLPYKEGDMGVLYGWNWRHFGAEYKDCNTDYTGKGFDQLKKIIDEIKNNPNSRRILMTDFNPAIAHLGVLYPCHSLILQFYIRENKYLDVKMYQRSVDSFLGLPFNISSTGLLLHIISKLTNKTAGRITLTLGDCHIYESHKEQVERQLKRLPYDLPEIEIPDFKNLEEVENSKLEDYKIKNYNCHKGIKAQMIA